MCPLLRDSVRGRKEKNQEVLTKTFHLGNSRSSGPELVKAVIKAAYTGTESGLSIQLVRTEGYYVKSRDV